jgi:hypothetical protein
MNKKCIATKSSETDLTEQFCGAPIGAALRRLENSEIDFCVIRHSPELHNANLPLLLLIHPGDLIQITDMYDPPAQRNALAAFWRYTGCGTRDELASFRMQGFDFCVLHRSSCAQFPSFSKYRVIGRTLWQEIKRGHARGAVLYGDDLEAASEWVIEHLGISERPRIHLAGAYSDPSNGCLTAVGQSLEKVIEPGRITVSEFSPPENGPGIVWRPGNKTCQMSVPENVKKLYACL